MWRSEPAEKKLDVKKNKSAEEKSQDSKRQDFFMVPNAIVKSGLWARMKPSEKDVYIVLAQHAHYDSGLAYPSVRTIAKLSGRCLEAVLNATKKLVEYGLIEKKKARRRIQISNGL